MRHIYIIIVQPQKRLKDFLPFFLFLSSFHLFSKHLDPETTLHPDLFKEKVVLILQFCLWEFYFPSKETVHENAS